MSLIPDHLRPLAQGQQARPATPSKASCVCRSVSHTPFGILASELQPRKGENAKDSIGVVDDFKVLSLPSLPARSVLLSFPASYPEACSCSIIHSYFGIVTEEQLASELSSFELCRN